MRPPLPADLDLVADLIYIRSVGRWSGFYIECGACNRHSDIEDEVDLPSIIEWALTHHELAPV